MGIAEDFTNFFGKQMEILFTAAEAEMKANVFSNGRDSIDIGCRCD